MPTKKKRFGFIPREDVIKIIDKLSIENNLSNSKIISILVEEALTSRGIFNKKSGKLSQLYVGISDSSENSIQETSKLLGNEKLINNINFKNQSESLNTSFKQNKQDIFDLQTYKKFLLFLKFQEMIGE